MTTGRLCGPYDDIETKHWYELNISVLPRIGVGASLVI